MMVYWVSGFQCSKRMYLRVVLKEQAVRAASVFFEMSGNHSSFDSLKSMKT